MNNNINLKIQRVQKNLKIKCKSFKWALLMEKKNKISKMVQRIKMSEDEIWSMIHAAATLLGLKQTRDRPLNLLRENCRKKESLKMPSGKNALVKANSWSDQRRLMSDMDFVFAITVRKIDLLNLKRKSSISRRLLNQWPLILLQRLLRDQEKIASKQNLNSLKKLISLRNDFYLILLFLKLNLITLFIHIYIFKSVNTYLYIFISILYSFNQYCYKSIINQFQIIKPQKC